MVPESKLSSVNKLGMYFFSIIIFIFRKFNHCFSVKFNSIKLFNKLLNAISYEVETAQLSALMGLYDEVTGYMVKKYAINQQ